MMVFDAEPPERYDHNANNISGCHPIDWETDLVPIQVWREQAKRIIELEAALADIQYRYDLATIPPGCEKGENLKMEAAPDCYYCQLEVEVERLRGIVDALPKTADGVTLRTGMTAWIVPHTQSVSGRAPIFYGAEATPVQVAMIGEQGVLCFSEDGLQPLVQPRELASTREAAEAAEAGRGE